MSRPCNLSPETVSLRFPGQLLPCDDHPDNDEPARVPVPLAVSPDMSTDLMQCLQSVASALMPAPDTEHPDGYALAGLTLPLGAFMGALGQRPALAAVAEEANRWQQRGATDVIVRLPRRIRHLGVRTRVWGHDTQDLSVQQQQATLKQADYRCAFCGYESLQNTVLVRNGDPADTAPDNRVVACQVCAPSQQLNTLSARDGVMVWLPALRPAALSHLLRATFHARRQGNAQQKEHARSVLGWLVSHRHECEAFWGTSHPGEFGEALLRADADLREDLLLRLRHMMLIPSPSLLSR